jgi:PAS domain S-box-containing protein
VPVSGSEIIWTLIVGTIVLATLGFIFVASIVFNQRRYIGVQRQKLEAVQKSEQYFRSLTENSFDAIALCKPNGSIVYASNSTERVLGYPTKELIGRNATQLILKDDALELEKILNEQLKRKNARAFAHFRAQHKDGTWRWIEGVAMNLLEEPSVEAIIVNYRDITERKQSEQQLKKSHDQLRDLSAHLQSVREEERTQIAREIHDELGQMLTVLKMDISFLKKKLIDSNDDRFPFDANQELLSMTNLVDSTIQSVRRIATELRPEILDELGIRDAIEWASQVFESRSGIKTVFSSNAVEIPLDRDRSTALFRIFQETLTNVARHANATKVTVNLECSDHELRMTIIDNGRGATDEELSSSRSLGILGMRERAILIGGEVNVAGQVGMGTTVSIRVPLK